MSSKELIQTRSVNLYPSQWDVIKAHAKQNTEGSVSAAVRRIVDEWLELRMLDNRVETLFSAYELDIIDAPSLVVELLNYLHGREEEA